MYEPAAKYLVEVFESFVDLPFHRDESDRHAVAGLRLLFGETVGSDSPSAESGGKCFPIFVQRLEQGSALRCVAEIVDTMLVDLSSRFG